jgi:S1-C subfamily serine protease
MTRLPARLAALALLGASPLALAACGGDDDAPTATTRTAAGTGTGSVTTVEDLPTEDGQATSGRGVAIDARQVYDRLGNGVVTVLARGASGGQESGGLGSGFVISDRGEIVTNAHVVTSGSRSNPQRAKQVFIRFADRNQVEAKILGTDRFNDVALLQVKPEDLDLVPLRFAGPTDAKVGDPVMAIGSPFGEEQSVSIGVVSALDRSIQSLSGFDTVDAIQTDAAINRGNSGGPLLDARGRVLGINSQIETSTGDGSGVGFAVSSDTVRRAVDQIRKVGSASYPYLGVSTVEVYPQLAKRFDLGTTTGAWIQLVPEDGPADAAGLRGPTSSTDRPFQVGTYRTGGDVIVGIDDQPVRSSSDLAEVAQRFRPGQTVTVRVIRDGKKRDVRTKLGRRPTTAPRD